MMSSGPFTFIYTDQIHLLGLSLSRFPILLLFRFLMRFSDRSEEMRPEWFSASVDVSSPTEPPPIPFDKMWETDYVWLPLLVAQKSFAGRADYVGEKDKSKPYKWWCGLLEEPAAVESQ
jgi:hypothetical protein